MILSKATAARFGSSEEVALGGPGDVAKFSLTEPVIIALAELTGELRAVAARIVLVE